MEGGGVDTVVEFSIFTLCAVAAGLETRCPASFGVVAVWPAGSSLGWVGAHRPCSLSRHHSEGSLRQGLRRSRRNFPSAKRNDPLANFLDGLRVAQSPLPSSARVGRLVKWGVGAAFHVLKELIQRHAQGCLKPLQSFDGRHRVAPAPRPRCRSALGSWPVTLRGAPPAAAEYASRLTSADTFPLL